MARQVPDLHPGKNQETRVVNHPRQVLLTSRPTPSDPFIACLDRFGCSRHQRAAQQSSVADDEVAKGASKRLTVSQVVVPIEVFIPQLGLVPAFHKIQSNRPYSFQLADKHLIRRSCPLS